MMPEELNLTNEKKLPVNPVLQEFNYDCGKAAVKTLLKTLGIDVEEQKLQDILKTDEVAGTHPTRIIEALESLGLEFVEKIGATVADIEEKIIEGFYCLVVYQAWGTPEDHATLESGHYSLAYGVSDDDIHLADPAVTVDDELGMGDGLRAIPKEDFNRDWIDQDLEGNLFDHWMVAVKGR